VRLSRSANDLHPIQLWSSVVHELPFVRKGQRVRPIGERRDVHLIDEVLRPDPGSAHPAKFPADPNANKMHPRWASHPRDARIIPKSRDFH